VTLDEELLIQQIVSKRIKTGYNAYMKQRRLSSLRSGDITIS
jgi:hypothetical protein